MDQLENLAATPRIRRDGWTPERRTQFLECLSVPGCDVRRACAAVGLSRKSAYHLRKRDPAFAAAWDDALRRAGEEATRSFLAGLPESLLRTLSQSSTPCHLQPADRPAPAMSESLPRTRSTSSTSCHLRR